MWWDIYPISKCERTGFVLNQDLGQTIHSAGTCWGQQLSFHSRYVWILFVETRSLYIVFFFSFILMCFLFFKLGWVGLWGFLWWAPSAKRKDHHGVSSGWSSVWHCSNTGLSSSQYEQISIILGVWPFCLTPFFFWSMIFWWAHG